MRRLIKNSKKNFDDVINNINNIIENRKANHKTYEEEIAWGNMSNWIKDVKDEKSAKEFMDWLDNRCKNNQTNSLAEESACSTIYWELNKLFN